MENNENTNKDPNAHLANINGAKKSEETIEKKEVTDPNAHLVEATKSNEISHGEKQTIPTHMIQKEESTDENEVTHLGGIELEKEEGEEKKD